MRRRITILGATGSVGQNTVALLEAQGGAEAYEVVALTGGGNVALLAEQARRLGARIAVTADPARLAELEAALAGSGIAGGGRAGGALRGGGRAGRLGDVGDRRRRGPRAGARARAPRRGAGARQQGEPGLRRRAGAADLRRARHAADPGRQRAQRHLPGAARRARRTAVERLILTASGGPFRDWTPRQMAAVTPEQARAHPNWDMGERISIDSATMFNKALEVIEARALFGVAPEQIEVVVHPQSVVHSMVGFRDGSILAQLGPSDMRGAIGYALNWPERRRAAGRAARLRRAGRLDFAPADPERFPALRLAREVMRARRAGGGGLQRREGGGARRLPRRRDRLP